MKLNPTTRNSIVFLLTGISLASWVLMVINPGDLLTIKHCHVTTAGPSEASLKMLLSMNPVSELMIGWMLMVVAMMLPKLIVPVSHICETSFSRYRIGASVAFIVGYCMVWSLAGIALNAIILASNFLYSKSYIPAAIIGITALIWQFSPIKQKFLNRGHDHWSLPAYSYSVFKRSFSFGVAHGIWCVGAGWAIMLFPMVLPKGHHIAMFVVTLIMISEHIEHPKIPAWNLNLRLKLFRILYNQSKIKVQLLLNRMQ